MLLKGLGGKDDGNGNGNNAEDTSQAGEDK